jgi:hypothetical protein
MPTVIGSVEMSDPEYMSKIRKSVLNAIINSPMLPIVNLPPPENIN